MPTVPISQLPQASAGGGLAPTDTDTAIAAALMHREGGFDDQDTTPPKSNVVKMRRKRA